ncbi:MAG: MarR family transcriptional regulator [Rhodospirillales bacterium]|jgi:DNA-binding MarR family transcriptional regulator|nr:MarR family transcriptional regulator [Rhodospirillales bacterium]
MTEGHQTPKTSAITDMIFESFRLHGQLIAFGDQMVKEFGLTSARWQILGSISIANNSVTVPKIARNLGLSRQAVQRVTNDLERDGFVIFADNPDHKRAKLVVLTDMGHTVYREADRKYLAWLKSNIEPFKLSSVQTAIDVMQTLGGCCTTYLDKTEVDVDK